MSGILRFLSSRAAPGLRGPSIIQRANICSRPAKENIGPLEWAIGFVMLGLSILGPSGWILAHVEDYKKKD